MSSFSEMLNKKPLLALSFIFLLLIWLTVVTLQIAFNNCRQFIRFALYGQDSLHLQLVLEYFPQLSFAIIYACTAFISAPKPIAQDQKRQVIIAILVNMMLVLILFVLTFIEWSSKTFAVLFYIVSWLILNIMAYYFSLVFRILFSLFIFAGGKQFNAIVGIFGITWSLSYFTAFLIGSSLSVIYDIIPDSDELIIEIERKGNGGYGFALGMALAVAGLIQITLPDKFELEESNQLESNQILVRDEGEVLQQQQQLNDNVAVQRGNISLVKLIFSKRGFSIAITLIPPIFFLITLQNHLGQIYGPLDYNTKWIAQRNLAYFWYLFIIPIIMVGVGALIGFLVQIKIDSRIVFFVSSVALGILLMFYDPCFCFLLSPTPDEQCIDSGSMEPLQAITKSRFFGQIAAKILTGIFYGIYFTATASELKAVYAQEFKIADHRLVCDLIAGTFIGFMGLQNVIGNIYLMIYRNLSTDFLLGHIQSTLGLKYIFGSLFIVGAVLFALFQQKLRKQQKTEANRKQLYTSVTSQ